MSAAQCLADCDGNGRRSAFELAKINELLLACPCSGGVIGGNPNGCAEAAGLSCLAADENMDGCIKASEKAKINEAVLQGGSACPRCGNGVLESGEACDDGNNYGADGCAGNCTVEQTVSLDLGGATCVGGDFIDQPCDSSEIFNNFGCYGGVCGTTSVTVLHSARLTISMLLSGRQQLEIGGITGAGGTIGADGFTNFSSGQIPVTAKVTDGMLNRADIPGVGCACVRGRAVNEGDCVEERHQLRLLHLDERQRRCAGLSAPCRELPGGHRRCQPGGGARAKVIPLGV